MTFDDAAQDSQPPEPYQVKMNEVRYQVLTAEGTVVLECSAAAHADQYAVLLTQAYWRGYKAGI